MSNKLLVDLVPGIRQLTEITAAIHRERVVLAQADLEAAESNFDKSMTAERVKALEIQKTNGVGAMPTAPPAKSG